MFDLQRNLLTTLLAAGIALTVLAGGAMALFLGRANVERIEPLGRTSVPESEVSAPETGLQAFDEYTAILERPVFFSDRRLPVVEAPGEMPEPEEVAEPETEEIGALEAAVAGIVITPEMRLAMVTDEQAGETLVLREGMSLEGEQAAWKLETIEPRQVRFVSVDGQETDLELQVKTSGLKSPAAAQRRRERAAEADPQEPSPDAQQSAQAGASDEATEAARARAEEIRRRVAERRAQLRAEAERRAKQRQEQQDNNG
jgi:general secretion pathway protein N